MILNPNCSETVIRLKHRDIGNFTKEEMKVYLHLISDEYSAWGYSDTPVEGYSELWGNKKWKAHYYYQTVGNEIQALAFWIGIDFDTDEVWNSGDLLSMEEAKQYDIIQEELSYLFTVFEDVISEL